MLRASFQRALVRGYGKSKFQNAILQNLENHRQNLYVESFPGTGKTTAIIDEIVGDQTPFGDVEKLIIVSRTGRANSITERICERSENNQHGVGKLLARDQQSKRRKRESFLSTVQSIANKPILVAQLANNSRINKAFEENLLPLESIQHVYIFDTDRILLRKNEQYLRRLFRIIPKSARKVVVSDGLSETSESALNFLLGPKFEDLRSKSEPSLLTTDIEICKLSSLSKDIVASGEKRFDEKVILCYTQEKLDELKKNFSGSGKRTKCMTVNNFLHEQTSCVEIDCFLAELPRFSDCIDLWTISMLVPKLRIYIDSRVELDIRLEAVLSHLKSD